MKIPPFLKKSVAGFVALSFTLSSISYAAPITLNIVKSEPSPSSNFSLTIPETLGKIEHLISGKGPALIHIQTAHGNFEAQKNIQAILHYLKKNYGFKTVFVEGGHAKLQPEVLRFSSRSKEQASKIHDELTRKAILKGADLFLLEDSEAQGYGIEDLETYLANGEAFKSVIRAKEKTQFFIQAMDLQIERFASSFLNKDLRAFLERQKAYENHIVSFESWIEELKNLSQKYMNQNPSDPVYQYDWPMLVRYFKLLEFEKKIDSEALVREKEFFLKEIQKLSSFSALKNLLDSSLTSSLSSPDTELLVEQMVAALPRNFDYTRYKNLNYFIGQQILRSELKGEKLIAEIERLSDILTAKLAGTPEEKKLLTFLEDHKLLQKLFRLELTPGDYEAVLKRGPKPSSFVRFFENFQSEKRVRQIEFQHLAEIDSLYEQAVEFYRLVKKRDRILLENTARKIKDSGIQKAVVITGGFHAGPFKEYFLSQNVDYALITPKISNTDFGRSAYLDAVFQGESQKSTYETPEILYRETELRQLDVNPHWLRQEIQSAVQFSKISAMKEVARSETRGMDRAALREFLSGLERWREIKASDHIQKSLSLGMNDFAIIASFDKGGWGIQITSETNGSLFVHWHDSQVWINGQLLPGRFENPLLDIGFEAEYPKLTFRFSGTLQNYFEEMNIPLKTKPGLGRGQGPWGWEIKFGGSAYSRSESRNKKLQEWYRELREVRKGPIRFEGEGLLGLAIGFVALVIFFGVIAQNINNEKLPVEAPAPVVIDDETGRKFSIVFEKEEYAVPNQATLELLNEKGIVVKSKPSATSEIIALVDVSTGKIKYPRTNTEEAFEGKFRLGKGALAENFAQGSLVWSQVLLPHGEKGWILDNYLVREKVSPPRSESRSSEFSLKQRVEIFPDRGLLFRYEGPFFVAFSQNNNYWKVRYTLNEQGVLTLSEHEETPAPRPFTVEIVRQFGAIMVQVSNVDLVNSIEVYPQSTTSGPRSESRNQELKVKYPPLFRVRLVGEEAMKVLRALIPEGKTGRLLFAGLPEDLGAILRYKKGAFQWQDNLKWLPYGVTGNHFLMVDPNGTVYGVKSEDQENLRKLPAATAEQILQGLPLSGPSLDTLIAHIEVAWKDEKKVTTEIQKDTNQVPQSIEFSGKYEYVQRVLKKIAELYPHLIPERPNLIKKEGGYSYKISFSSFSAETPGNQNEFETMRSETRLNAVGFSETGIIFPPFGFHKDFLEESGLENETRRKVYATAQKILGPKGKIDALMASTLNTVTAQITLWESLKSSHGNKLPAFILGPSRGSSAAYYASGFLNFEQTVEATVRNVLFLQKLAPLSGYRQMGIVLGLKEADLKSLLGSLSLFGVISVRYSPQVFAISIDKKNLSALENEIQLKGGKFKKSDFTISSHDPYIFDLKQPQIKKIYDQYVHFWEGLARDVMRDPKIPLYSTVYPGKLLTQAGDIVKEELDSLTQPVFLDTAIAAAAQKSSKGLLVLDMSENVILRQWQKNFPKLSVNAISALNQKPFSSRSEMRIIGTVQPTKPILHVLVAEDDGSFTQLYRRLFEKISGVEFHYFPDGKSAYEYLEDHPEIGLVITDIRMPYKDGRKLISDSRKILHLNIPFLVASGESFDAIMIKAEFGENVASLSGKVYPEHLNFIQQLILGSYEVPKTPFLQGIPTEPHEPAFAEERLREEQPLNISQRSEVRPPVDIWTGMALLTGMVALTTILYRVIEEILGGKQPRRQPEQIRQNLLQDLKNRLFRIGGFDHLDRRKVRERFSSLMTTWNEWQEEFPEAKNPVEVLGATDTQEFLEVIQSIQKFMPSYFSYDALTPEEQVALRSHLFNAMEDIDSLPIRIAAFQATAAYVLETKKQNRLDTSAWLKVLSSLSPAQDAQYRGVAAETILNLLDKIEVNENTQGVFSSYLRIPRRASLEEIRGGLQLLVENLSRSESRKDALSKRSYTILIAEGDMPQIRKLQEKYPGKLNVVPDFGMGKDPVRFQEALLHYKPHQVIFRSGVNWKNKETLGAFATADPEEGDQPFRVGVRAGSEMDIEKGEAEKRGLVMTRTNGSEESVAEVMTAFYAHFLNRSTPQNFRRRGLAQGMGMDERLRMAMTYAPEIFKEAIIKSEKDGRGVLTEAQISDLFSSYEIRDIRGAGTIHRRSKIGFAGWGAIPKVAALKMQLFDKALEVTTEKMAWSPSLEEGRKKAPEGVRSVSKQQMMEEATAISIHLPTDAGAFLTATDLHVLANRATTIHPIAIFNLSRFASVDHQALLTLFRQLEKTVTGLHLYYYADIDLTDKNKQTIEVLESLRKEFPRNVFMSNHIAAFTAPALRQVESNSVVETEKLFFAYEKGNLIPTEFDFIVPPKSESKWLALGRSELRVEEIANIRSEELQQILQRGPAAEILKHYLDQSIIPEPYDQRLRSFGAAVYYEIASVILGRPAFAYESSASLTKLKTIAKPRVTEKLFQKLQTLSSVQSPSFAGKVFLTENMIRAMIQENPHAFHLLLEGARRHQTQIKSPAAILATAVPVAEWPAFISELKKALKSQNASVELIHGIENGTLFKVIKLVQGNEAAQYLEAQQGGAVVWDYDPDAKQSSHAFTNFHISTRLNSSDWPAMIAAALLTQPAARLLYGISDETIRAARLDEYVVQNLNIFERGEKGYRLTHLEELEQEILSNQFVSTQA